jgi:hypothetical protein
MAANKKKNPLQKYLSSNKSYPILYAIAAGLYPILFYFTNNYTIVNTWSHVGYFLVMFLLLPIVVFMILHFVALLSFFVAIGFSFFFHGFFKKLVVFQLILALIGVYTLAPRIIKLINYSDAWTVQPDNIKSVRFVKKPNVYFIQPDGYANFSELRKENYKVDYSKFEEFLMKENFKYYEDFRSNYASTLSSNSATFMMKHHYYNNGTSFSEALNARNIIISDNAVLSIFKNNNYKTHFISELPYLILNRPKLGYDVSNFEVDDVSFIGTGLGETQDVIQPLKDRTI